MDTSSRSSNCPSTESLSPPSVMASKAQGCTSDRYTCSHLSLFKNSDWVCPSRRLQCVLSLIVNPAAPRSRSAAAAVGWGSCWAEQRGVTARAGMGKGRQEAKSRCSSPGSRSRQANYSNRELPKNVQRAGNCCILKQFKTLVLKEPLLPTWCLFTFIPALVLQLIAPNVLFLTILQLSLELCQPNVNRVSSS